MPRDFDSLTVQVDGCLLWQGELSHNGYGRYCVGYNNGHARRVAAHRFAWMRVRGEIPAGYQIDHLCKNRACVNVDHLEVVTPAENIHRSDCPAAQHRRATHCVRGHPLSGSNLYVTPDGRRQCRCCRRAADARNREKVTAHATRR